MCWELSFKSRPVEKKQKHQIWQPGSQISFWGALDLVCQVLLCCCFFCLFFLPLRLFDKLPWKPASSFLSQPADLGHRSCLFLAICLSADSVGNKTQCSSTDLCQSRTVPNKNGHICKHVGNFWEDCPLFFFLSLSLPFPFLKLRFYSKTFTSAPAAGFLSNREISSPRSFV